MNYRYLALDFDGTLLTSDHIIDSETKNALIDAQRAGIQLILASGRPTYAMLKFAEELATDQFGGYLLSFNGSYMFDLKTNQKISTTELTKNEVSELYNYSKNFDFSVLIYDDSEILIDNLNEFAEVESDITGMTIREITDFNRPSAKAIFVHSPEYIDAIQAQVTAELSGKFTISRSMPSFLEVTPNGVDKGSSLATLFNLINAEKSQLIACGDGGNDLTMIQYAGLGVAMENARDEVKAAADFITFDNNSQGIVHVIDTFIR